MEEKRVSLAALRLPPSARMRCYAERMGLLVRGRVLLLCAFATTALACNLITGESNLEVGKGGASSQGGAAAGGSGPSTGKGPSGTGSSPSATGSTGAGSACPPCGANQHCEDATSTCVCNPGFANQGGTCVAVPPGDPSTRTQTEVCARWNQDHQLTTAMPFVPGAGGDCDQGTLLQGGITDTLTRINLFRWLDGLGPVSDDTSLDQTDQLCANMESWWDFSSGLSPHMPPPTTKCYTAQGASGAGMSNIAWGNGPAQSIDQFVEDQGNETTMGHRRWIVNPPLGPVGIGYWEGGGTYGSAECLAIFGMSGGGPNPPWVAVPNQGVVPDIIATWTWTFSSSIGGTASAQASVLRVDDNTPLAVTMVPLAQGYGQDTISWVPSGWAAEAGKTYRVTISGLASGDVTYDVKPVSCP
jgi:hypothetical protein